MYCQYDICDDNSNEHYWSITYFFIGDGDHRDLNALTHACPTRRPSDLRRERDGGAGRGRARQGPRRRRDRDHRLLRAARGRRGSRRSEEHTSELQSLMRMSYAVFCLEKKRNRATYSIKGA